MRCTGRTRENVACRNNAITGGVVCRMHGGSAPRVKALAAVRAEVSKWQLGDATDDPGEVLLRLITQSRRRVEMYNAEIDRKVEEGMKIWGDEFELERILVGDQMFKARDGIAQKAGEYIRGLVVLEGEERDRLANFAAKAIAAGIAERQVRLAERQGNVMAMVMSAAMDRAGLSQAQQDAVIIAMQSVFAEEQANRQLEAGDW